MSHKHLLEESGALVPGHFVYASHRHGGHYVNKMAGLVLASHAREHAAAIAAQYAQHGVEAVVAPELGAISLATRVADRLFELTGYDIACVVATKVPGSTPQAFEVVRDQARFIFAKRTIVVEDLLTTGASAAAAVVAARAAGAEVIGVGALWNRGGVTANQLDVRHLICCVDERIKDYAPEDCPYCRDDVSVRTDLGKGAAFLAEREAAGQ